MNAYDSVPLISGLEIIQLNASFKAAADQGTPLEVPIGMALGDMIRFTKTLVELRQAASEYFRVLDDYNSLDGSSTTLDEVEAARKEVELILNVTKPVAPPPSRLILPR